MSHTENYICGFFCYDQTSCYFPWNEVTAWQTFLLSSWRNAQLAKTKDQLWPSGMWYCDMVTYSRRPVMIVTSMRTLSDTRCTLLSWDLKDLSSSLTWHRYICPKMAQTIFIIFTLILSSTFASLPCSSSHFTSFAKILYPVICPA